MGKSSRRGENREALREQLWPGSSGLVWKSAKETGYFPSPRNLPLITHLINEKAICGNLNPSSVYVELLHRDMGEGIVEVVDEDEHAFCAGYIGGRAVRTWKERVLALEKAGFIKVFPKGNRAIGYIGILHPNLAVAKLRRENKVSDAWWHLYQDLQRKVGASAIPSDPAVPEKPLGRPKVVSMQGLPKKRARS